ncbi:MAG: SRPBCC family protein [Actinomycetota bacterium]|nr:SRPBCC family protein [Actinomycetota bacterium]
MAIDVTVTETIGAPRVDVAGYVMDHRNDAAWIGGISESTLLGDEPLGVGSDVRRVASFMGKRIEYVNRVDSLDPGRTLAMHSIESPFPMRVTYSFEDAPGGVEASVRVQGEPAAMYRVAGPLLARQVRRSVSRDLRTLKELMEASTR